MYFIDFLSRQTSADQAKLKSLSNVKRFRSCMQRATCDGFLPTLSSGLRGEMVENPRCVNTRPDPNPTSTRSPPLLERDQVGTTQGRCFLLEGLVRRIRAVLIQYLVKTDDFIIVVGPQARIHRDHDRVTAQRCSDRRVEYRPADLPAGENEHRDAFCLKNFVQVGIEKPVLPIGHKSHVALLG